MAHVQTFSSTGFFDTAQPTGNTTSGNTLVALGIIGGGHTGVLTDSNDNTWVPHAHTNLDLDSSSTLCAWYCENCVGGDDHSFVLGDNEEGSFFTLYITELSGRAKSSSLDDSSFIFNLDDTTSHTGPSVTVATGSDIVAIAGCKYGDSPTFTQGSGWTIPTNGNRGSDTLPSAIEYKSSVTAGTYAPSITTDLDEATGWLVFAFKQSSGGTPVTASPTGTAATGGVGSVAAIGAALALIAGAAGTGGVGTIAPPVNVNMTIAGAAATGVVGTVTTTNGTTALPTGAAATGGVGVITINGIIKPTGVSATGGVGSLAAVAAHAATTTLTGVTGTSGVGVIAPPVSVNVTVAGVSAASGVGSVITTINGSTAVNVVGIAATGGVGTLAQLHGSTAVPPGVQATSGVGGMNTVGSGTATATVAGVSGSTGVGAISLSYSARAVLTGASATGNTGVISFTPRLPPPARIFKATSGDSRIAGVRPRIFKVSSGTKT